MSSVFPIQGLEFVKGDPVESFQTNQAYVLEFWATWCPPCRTSIPHLTELQKKFKDIVFIGISNEEKAVVSKFAKEMGSKMDYRVAVDPEGITQKYMTKYNVQGIPHAFVIDKEGKMCWHGHPTDNSFEKTLTALCTKKAEKEEEHIALLGDEESLHKASIHQLKLWMDQNSVSYAGLLEKDDLIQAIKASGKLA